MIESKNLESPETVGSHYNDLDPFYREIWGTHVHHGYWDSGSESVQEATRQLLTRLLSEIPVPEKMKICDIGCGYGESSRYLAKTYNAQVVGYTISKAQYDFAVSHENGNALTQYILEDWLENKMDSNSFDLALAIESTEHLSDLPKFFSEAHRVLRPSGNLKICAWLAKEKPNALEERFLLQPICTEGRLRMGTANEYLDLMKSAGFKNPVFEDVTDKVKKTWTLCMQRVLQKFLSDKKYINFFLRNPSKNKSFLMSLLRIRVAYETKTMSYGFFSATK